MKTILFLITIVTLIFGSTVPASAGPLGTYSITVKGAYVDDDGSHPVRAKGTLKLTSVKGEFSVLNLSGKRGRGLLRFSKPVHPTATTQKIKGTVKDLNYDGKGTFTGKLVRSGSHYKITAEMRMTDSEGVMKGTITATK
jgi:hypothetical protein